MPQRRFFTGSSGVSTGPHLHAALFDPQTKEWLDPSPHMGALLFQGQPLEKVFKRSSGYGHRKAPTAGASTFHQGVDVATPLETEVEVAGGSWRETRENKGYGRESVYDWTDPNGRKLQWLLAHGDRNRNALGALEAASAQVQGQISTAGGGDGASQSPAPSAPAPPDWRAAAADPGRSRDPLSAAYWEREDMKQWAAANPRLAAPLLSAAGLQAMPAPASPSAGPSDRGALNGTQVGRLSAS